MYNAKFSIPIQQPNGLATELPVVEKQNPMMDEDGFHTKFSERVNEYLQSLNNPPVFNTNANNAIISLTKVGGHVDVVWNNVFLFNHFLAQLPEDQRQRYNCHCCRAFIKKVGGLVVIDPESGLTKSLLWDSSIIADKFKPSFDQIRDLVEKAEITEVFQSNSQTFGQKVAGGYAHMCLELNQVFHRTHDLKGPEHARNQSVQDYKLFKDSLKEVEPELIKRALVLFKNDKNLKDIYPSFEKRFEILERLSQAYKNEKHLKIKDNLIWNAVAVNTPDIIHFKSSVIGQFLKRLDSQETPDDAINEFKALVKQEVYLRPTQAPKEGTIAVANKIIEELNLQASFERRQAQLEDITEFVWKPQESSKPSVNSVKPGFFSGIETQGKKSDGAQLPLIEAGVMTWVKFAKTYLTQAKKISLFTPGHKIENWAGLITAVHPDCVPILRDDRLEKRRHVSGYGITNGSYSSDWNIPGNTLVPIVGITEVFHQSLKGEDPPIILLIDNAGNQPSLCLFPVLLRPELHEVRSVIEGYSNSRQLVLSPKPVAGFLIGRGYIGATLIVETDDARVSVAIDRFE